MGSHFAAIGLPASASREDLAKLLPLAERVGGDGTGVVVLAYDDPSGSRLTFTVQDRQLVCVTPSFRPRAVVEANFHGLTERECPYEHAAVMAVINGGEEAYPLALQIEDLAISRAAFAAPFRGHFEIAALAESLSYYHDEPAYRESGTLMAVRLFVPSGMFAPDAKADPKQLEVRPRALISGEVVRAESFRHTLFEREFARLTIASYGATFEVAVAEADLTPDGQSRSLPAIGSIVSGEFWLSGRLIERQRAVPNMRR